MSAGEQPFGHVSERRQASSTVTPNRISVRSRSAAPKRSNRTGPVHRKSRLRMEAALRAHRGPQQALPPSPPSLPPLGVGATRRHPLPQQARPVLKLSSSHVPNLLGRVDVSKRDSKYKN